MQLKMPRMNFPAPPGFNPFHSPNGKAAGSSSEAESAAGRALVKRYADAIVSVELVVTIKLKSGEREMPPREQRVEVNGTVLSADGLTV